MWTLIFTYCANYRDEKGVPTIICVCKQWKTMFEDSAEINFLRFQAYLEATLYGPQTVVVAYVLSLLQDKIIDDVDFSNLTHLSDDSEEYSIKCECEKYDSDDECEPSCEEEVAERKKQNYFLFGISPDLKGEFIFPRREPMEYFVPSGSKVGGYQGIKELLEQVPVLCEPLCFNAKLVWLPLLPGVVIPKDSPFNDSLVKKDADDGQKRFIIDLRLEKSIVKSLGKSIIKRRYEVVKKIKAHW